VKDAFYLRILKIPFKERIYHRFYENGKRKEEIFDFPVSFVIKNNASLNDYPEHWGVYKKFISNEEYLLVKDKKIDTDSYKVEKPDIKTLFTILKYPEPIRYDKSKIRILNIDIEVHSEKEFPKPEIAKHPIVSITCQDMVENKFWVFALGKEVEIKQPNVKAFFFDSEKELIVKFLKFYQKFHPDIITGWYISGFDIPYIQNRIVNLFQNSEKRLIALATFSLISKKLMKEVIDVYLSKRPLKDLEDYLKTKIHGAAVLDYIDLYKKFQLKKLSSYSLDSVASFELGEHKIDYSEYLSLKNLYKENFQKFIEYNIRDVELVYLIDKKVKFIDLTLLMSYAARSDFEDVLGVVKRWEKKIFYYLMTEYKTFICKN